MSAALIEAPWIAEEQAMKNRGARGDYGAFDQRLRSESGEIRRS